MKKRYGVIDLGTNTFHLLISEKDADGNLTDLFRERVFVKLGEEGIETISDLAFRRALQALDSFKKLLDHYEVREVKAIGTAALRTATNGIEIIEKIRSETGIEVNLIPGDEEARLIHLGVVQAVPLNHENGLIMDIGGGSVEFILANNREVIWSESFPIGVSVLYRRFHKTDPISREEIFAIEQFLEYTLQPLTGILQNHKTSLLIGSSGTFDVLEAMLQNQRISSIHSIINVHDFFPLYDQFLKTTLDERFKMEHLPESRAELIIVALILIRFILRQTDFRQISVSAYAMKEGILYEMIR